MKLEPISIVRNMRIVDFRFSNYVSILSENAKFILIVSLASCVASFLGAGMLIDDVYWSEAEIRVLYPATSSIGRQSSDRSVVLVRERMTPDSLERVIVDNGLYPQERQNGSLAEALKAIGRDIATSGVREDVVRLAFQASDPGLAQKVASQLVSQYEDSTSDIPTPEYQVLRGLSAEIKKAEADLAREEEKVKDFNLRFLGGHLEKQTATLVTLNRLILQLQSNSDLLNALQEQKSSQEKFLTQQEHPPSSESSGGPLDSKAQVALKPADSSMQTNPSSLTFSEIQGKIDQFNKEIDQRKRQQTEIRKEMALYQARIDSAPKVRALQSAILRDYENAKRRYQELLAKKNETEMAKAGKKSSEPSFQVLSPASFPETPTNGRFMARLSGLLWGPLVAIGLVLLRSRRAELVSLEQVISQSGVPVLASIPWIPLGSVRPNSQAPDQNSHQSSTQTT
jgi:uncharacterized protein involved in exopolysaccharide biosynthesis